MKRAYNLMIGERTAEEIKLRIGSAYPMGQGNDHGGQGPRHGGGLPKTITITSQEVREAMLEPLNTIIDAVRTTLSAALRSFPLTWWTAASCWRVVVRSCVGWTNFSRKRRRCRCTWRKTR